MEKSYYDFYEEISDNELVEGLLGHGMFAEKLPPVFTSEPFYMYCMNNNPNYSSIKDKNYIRYENIRNSHIPRSLGIPNPMAYYNLVSTIKDNWNKIIEHMKNQTKDKSEHKISRLHIRKLYDKKAIFEMNYENWRVDGTPEPDLMIGKKFLVETDISDCFSSMYTHSLPWALVGKKRSKAERCNRVWFNELDKITRNTTHGETKGFLIGPHTSNILSEMILVAVDALLCDKVTNTYTRYIDDYTCFVETYEEGQKFLAELSNFLREYNLSLNHKKTAISKLPIPLEDSWIHKIKRFELKSDYELVKYSDVNAYIDYALKLMQENNLNGAILNYGLKRLSNSKLTDSAKNSVVKRYMHLTIIYPYLLSFLDTHLFERYDIASNDMHRFIKLLYSSGKKQSNYEAIAYALYFAAKYKISLDTGKDDDPVQDAKESQDCVLLTMSYIYYCMKDDKKKLKELKSHALTLRDSDEFERFWIFCYELLPTDELPDGIWKDLESAKVSFLKFPNARQTEKRVNLGEL